MDHLIKEKNVPTYFDKKWSQSSIDRIIRNEKYIGDLLGQKYYVEIPITHKHNLYYGEKEQYYVKDHHIAIISRENGIRHKKY